MELCPDQPVDGSVCFFSPCHSRHRHRSEALQFEGSISTQSRPRAAIPTSQPGVLLGLWLQFRSVEQHQTNRTRASLSCAVLCCAVLCGRAKSLALSAAASDSLHIRMALSRWTAGRLHVRRSARSCRQREADWILIQASRSRPGLRANPLPRTLLPAPCSLLSSTPELLTRSNVLIKTVQSKSP